MSQRSSATDTTSTELQLTDNGAPLDHDIVRGNTDGSLLDRERVLTDPRGHDGMEVWIWIENDIQYAMPSSNQGGAAYNRQSR